MRARHTTVFKTGNSAAVRLLGDCRLPRGTRVREFRDGARIVVEPVSQWPQSFLDALGAFKDEIPRPSDEDHPREPFDSSS